MKNIVSGILFLLCLGLVISPALGKVTVSRNQYGIPSIQADTEEDLFEAFGYTRKELLPFIDQAIRKAKPDEKDILYKVLTVLGDWDGRTVKDVVKDDHFQAGQTIFIDWLPRLMKATFDDEFEGIEDIKPINNRIFGLFLRCLDGPVSTLPVSRNYFDDITTQQEETVEDIFLQTLRVTVGQLKEKFKSEDPVTWKGPRAKIIFKHQMFGKVAEMWENNIQTYNMIVELRPEGAIGYSRFPLSQSGNIAAGPDKNRSSIPTFWTCNLYTKTTSINKWVWINLFYPQFSILNL